MLYFVATPIGNLKDVTLRAIETLNMVDEIACEDTRHSLTLLNALNVKKPLFSYHKFNEKESGEKIIEKLKNGKNIAVISDAGMPVISDPGNVLVNLLIENGLEYTVIPGASAFTSALVLSGFDSQRFTFLGFLPEKLSQKKNLIEGYKKLDSTLIFYSAPHDVKNYLEFLFNELGDRKIALVKEITKIHEKVILTSLKEGIDFEPKGEFVILVAGYDKEEEFKNLSLEEHVQKYIASGLSKKEAIKKVAKERNLPKSSLYKYTIN